MTRKPFGDWQSSTSEEDAEATAFDGNPALQQEVARDVAQWVGSITEPEEYAIGDTAHELEPKVLRGLIDAKPEE